MQEQNVAEEAMEAMASADWQGIVSNMADSLGTKAEYLWEVLVMGTFAEGLIGLILTSLVFLGFVLLAAFKLPKWIKSSNGLHEDEAQAIAGMVLSIITGIGVFTSGMVLASTAIDNGMKVAAPEYKALEKIISEVR